MSLLLRIDDRLLHGQVLLAWGARFAPDCVMLANDAVAADARDKARYECLADGEFEVVVESLAAAAVRLQGEPATRHLAVVANVRDALHLVQAGVRPQAIHLAGLRDPTGRRQLAPNIWLSAADVVDLQALVELGMVVELRDAPDIPGVLLPAETLAAFQSR